MYKSVGVISLRENSLVLDTDPELSRYYFNMLIKNYPGPFNRPRYAPHITIVKHGEYVFPENYDIVKSGIEIEFQYLPTVENSKTYFYIPIVENQYGVLAGIRFKHGLDWCFDKQKGFHITIANIK